MHITQTMTLYLKGFETGGKMVNGHTVLLPHGQPALTAYLDSEGVWTIGWGHTGRDVGPKTVITLAIAEQLFAANVAFFEHGVEHLIAGGAPTSQNQFDALVSFAFNCGLHAEETSTLLKYHRAGNYKAAADEFLRWTNHGKAGLVDRRQHERAIYLG
jgi:lysozyme